MTGATTEKTNDRPLVSVIIPTYNSGRTLQRAVMSIMNQTWQNTEVVIIDNASSDDTAGVASGLIGRFGGERIKFISRENLGVSAARNEGIRNISGDYFISLDGDDYDDPGMIELLYRAMDEADADTAICGMRKVYQKENGFARNYAEEYCPQDFSGTLDEFLDTQLTGVYDLHLIGTHANKLYKTGIVRENSVYYNEELQVNEDIDFVLRYLEKCGRVAVINSPGMNYVQHAAGQSLIGTFQPHGLRGALIVNADCGRLLKKAGEKTRQAMGERMFVHVCSFAGLMYYRSDYSSEKKLSEIKKLCADGGFKALLAELRPAGLKNRLAHFLLRHGLAFPYHILCMIIYRKNP